MRFLQTKIGKKRIFYARNDKNPKTPYEARDIITPEIMTPRNIAIKEYLF